jgi:hypothetical protein
VVSRVGRRFTRFVRPSRPGGLSWEAEYSGQYVFLARDAVRGAGGWLLIVAQLRSRSGPEGEGSVFVAWVGSIWMLLLRVSGEEVLKEKMEETGRGLILTLHTVLVYRVCLARMREWL